MKQLDARGLSCPEPVIMIRKAMMSGEKAYEILVDNPTSRDNVTRYAEHQGYTVTYATHADNANIGRISQLHLYDPVTFMDTEGSIYVYQIVRIDVIEPYQISDQLHETMDLTLFTCTSDGKDSVMLRCRRIRL